MVRIYFPKIPLVLTSPNSLETANGVNTLVFRTIPEVGKVSDRARALTRPWGTR